MADRGGEIILYKNGTCFWISNGFFYQTTEKGKYQFNNQTLTFKFKDEPNYNMIIKESTSETPYLCDTTIKEPNFSNCFIVTNNVLSKKQQWLTMAIIHCCSLVMLETSTNTKTPGYKGEDRLQVYLR